MVPGQTPSALCTTEKALSLVWFVVLGMELGALSKRGEHSTLSHVRSSASLVAVHMCELAKATDNLFVANILLDTSEPSFWPLLCIEATLPWFSVYLAFP